MKALAVGFGVVIALAFGLHWFLLREMNKDLGRNVLVAFGIPEEGEIQMHLSVTTGTYMRDPPRLGPHDRPLVLEWIDEHFSLHDDSGTRLRLKRHGSSGLLAKSKATISSEFYLIANLQQGKEYTLDFVPEVRRGDKYRHVFTAPSEGTDPWHLHFEPFEEESD